jgi:hypothetical protein
MATLLRLIFFAIVAPATAGLSANVFDIRSDSAEKKFFAGIEGTVALQVEEGLDSSKGQYSVSYSALGGGLVAQYFFSDFYLQSGVGLMRLMALTINNVKIDMTERVQWHVPFYLHAYYRLFPIFAMGAGFTHLTETTMYLYSQAIPYSSYNHLFLDLALQLKPEINDSLTLLATFVTGVNLIPGRQHVYSVGDLLHLRFQMYFGIVYALF